MKKSSKIKYSCNHRLEIKPFETNSSFDKKIEYAKRIGYKSAADAIGAKEFSSTSTSSAMGFSKAFDEYVEMIASKFGKDNVVDEKAIINKHKLARKQKHY